MLSLLKELSIKGEKGELMRPRAETGPSKIKSPFSARLSQKSSSVTDASSSRTGATTTTDMSHDGMSEVESAAEDSEKTQTTSDADSEKHGGATDSGDADTQEEGRG